MILLGIFIVIIIACLVLLFAKSIKILKGDEMAVLERFGKPVSYRDSGLNFILPFIDELIVYPKRRFAFTYEVECFTKETEEKEYKGIPVKVTVTAYVNFPREPRTLEELPEEKREELEKKGKDKEETHPLIIIRRNAIPKDEGLREYIGSVIEGIVRTTIGEISYSRLLTEKKEVEKALKKHLVDPQGELIRSGFSPKGLSIVIVEIKLPTELEKVLALFEVEKKEAEAAPYETLQRVIETVGAVASSLFPDLPVEKALQKFQQKYGEEKALEITRDLISREMAIKRGMFRHIHISTEGGNGKDFAKIVGALAGIAGAIASVKEEKKEPEKISKKEEEEKSWEEEWEEAESEVFGKK